MAVRVVVAGVLAAMGACGGESAAPLPTCEISAVSSGTLRASGTQLLDQHDRLITLRGVNAGGRSKIPPYAPFEFSDDQDYDGKLGPYLDRAQAWGFNVLRVPFSWNAVEPTRGSYDEAVLSRYDRLLDAAWARGIWTIVDFHQDVYAENFCGDGFPAWTLTDPPAPRHDCPKWFDAYTSDDRVRAAFVAFWDNEGGVRDDFGAMWTMMAARHASRPGVIGFEIINEPHGGTFSVRYFNEQVLPVFYAEVGAKILAEAPDALVFVDTSGSDGVTTSTRLERPELDNMVFAPHYYQPGALFGGGVSEDVLGPLTSWADKGVEWNVPVLLGEFGIVADHPDAVLHMRRQFQALDDLGMHGTAWEYSTSDELWNHEDLSVTDADGSERPALAGIVRPFVRALAGSALSHEYDAETATLRVSYEPVAGGVTEISLPTRLYPSARVTGSGACVQRDGVVLRVQPTEGTTRVEVVVEPE